MNTRDLDDIQSREEYEAWVAPPMPRPIVDPEDAVPMDTEKEHSKEVYLQGAFMGFIIGVLYMGIMVGILEKL
jgi:hypothetical protein